MMATVAASIACDIVPFHHPAAVVEQQLLSTVHTPWEEDCSPRAVAKRTCLRSIVARTTPVVCQCLCGVL